MAKRRRLAPPLFIAEDLAASVPVAGTVESSLAVGGGGAPNPAPEASMLSVPASRMPPIARIAGQTASEAALEALADDLRRARAEGRMIQTLRLDEVDAGYLVRDRLPPAAGSAAEDEMQALIDSLRARGQQVPIEVVDLGASAQPRYGLISGWRRLTALRQLAAEGHAPAAQVQALLRCPETAAAAYRAMVEENEIRAGLSYYERARIVARAVDQGVFAAPRDALAELFAASSRARRSKIGSFLRIHAALDGALRFPAAIPERLGLELARALDDAARPDFAKRLRERLRKSPPESVSAEQAVLTKALSGSFERAAPAPAAESFAVTTPAGKVSVSFAAGKVVLSGEGVTPALQDQLKSWLTGQ